MSRLGMRSCCFLVAFLVLLSCAKKTRHEVVLPPDISEIERKHKIVVTRKYTTPFEARMIDIAERTYPQRDEVLAVFFPKWELDRLLGPAPDAEEASLLREEGRARESDSPRARKWLEEGKLWWCSEFDGGLIPYAVTREAVDFYIGFMRKCRAGETSFGKDSDIEQSSELVYRAIVRLAARFEKDGRVFRDVYVVEMSMTVSVTFASLAGFHFQKNRLVVLDQDGNVLAVFGDGPPELIVS